MREMEGVGGRERAGRRWGLIGDGGRGDGDRGRWRGLEEAGEIWREPEGTEGIWREMEEARGKWRKPEGAEGIWRELEEAWEN